MAMTIILAMFFWGDGMVWFGLGGVCKALARKIQAEPGGAQFCLNWLVVKALFCLFVPVFTSNDWWISGCIHFCPVVPIFASTDLRCPWVQKLTHLYCWISRAQWSIYKVSQGNNQLRVSLGQAEFGNCIESSWGKFHICLIYILQWGFIIKIQFKLFII